MYNLDEEHAVEQVCQRLAARFPNLAPDNVRLAVEQAHNSMAGAPVRNYVPVLVEHAARKALTTATSEAPVNSLISG